MEVSLGAFLWGCGLSVEALSSHAPLFLLFEEDPNQWRCSYQTRWEITMATLSCQCSFISIVWGALATECSYQTRWEITMRVAKLHGKTVQTTTRQRPTEIPWGNNLRGHCTKWILLCSTPWIIWAAHPLDWPTNSWIHSARFLNGDQCAALTD